MVAGTTATRAPANPTVPISSDGEDWNFTKQSIGQTTTQPIAPTKAQQQDSSWFDYLFGPIPDDRNTSRDPPVESREPDNTAERSQPPPEKATRSVIDNIVYWLDPTPDIPPSKPPTGNEGEKKNGTNKTLTTQDSTAENNVDVDTKPESGLDSVNLAVSEERDTENASLVSNASSITASTQGKMFDDLDSLPSAQGDTLTQADSVKTSDLSTEGDASADGKNEATVVEEEAKQIRVPGDAIAPELVIPVVEGMDIDSKRQVLVDELQKTVAVHGQYDLRVAAIDAALGDLFDESEKREQAIKMYRAAVEIYASKLGDDNDKTMEAKLSLGRVLENAEKYDEAIGFYHHVTMMRRAIHGEKHPSSADALMRVAAALKKKGEYELAIKESKRALKVYRESLGDAHEKVSVTVDEIASLYKTVGDFEKAAAILEEVVKLKAATKGMKSKAVATTLVALASTYECAEDFSKAMKSLKKSYKIFTDIGGHSSMDATSILDKIAQLYEATGDNERASIAYLGVLRGRKIIYGEADLKVAETYFKLGHTLRHGGQHDKALKCMKEALPIFVSKGVEVHDVEMIAEVMHEMALMNKEKHRYSEAARIFKQELGVRRKIGQEEYPTIARTLNHLGVTEYEMKNNNKALKYLIEALTIYKDHAERSTECAEVLFNTGLVFEASRNKTRALDAYNEAVRIFRERGYKEHHPHLLKAVTKIEKMQPVKTGRR